MLRDEPQKQPIKGGPTFLIVINDFVGKTHGIEPGMTCVLCADGWYQVFKKNSHHKFCLRLSPEFVKETFKKNFRKV